MTMGARHKGRDRHTSMKNMVAQHGPHIFEQLGGGAAAPPGTADTPPASCPPRLLRIVHDSVRYIAGGGREPAFEAPSLDAIWGDPACRSLVDALPAAAKRARDGLRDGRDAADLRAEIRDFVIDDVTSMMAGRALREVRLGLLGDEQHEQEGHLGALSVIVSGHLADVLLEDCAGAPGKGLNPAGLVRTSLDSSEPVLYLIIKIVGALAKEVRNYISKLDPSVRSHPRIVLINTVAEAIERGCEPRALRDLQSGGDPGHRKRLAGPMAEAIWGEMARSLAGRQAKIDGPEAVG